MKSFRSLFAAAALLGTSLSTAYAATEVSIDFFHDHLDSYGDWREVGDYGYCWQPRDVDRDWRPYADGHWLFTDAGWTWDSDEPYAWAVYHYGRWANVENVGWVWAPGTEWGPAWVSWRRSPHHIGWAPLPPEARFHYDAGFATHVDADYDIGPGSYNFVDVRNFGAPHLQTVLIRPRENITIIHETTNITQTRYINHEIYNGGPRYEELSRESTVPIRRLRLDRRSDFDGDPHRLRAEQLQGSVEGDSFRVLAVPFDSRPATAPRKVAARVERAAVDRGWKNAGPPAEVEKLRTKFKSEPALQSEAAAVLDTPPAPRIGKAPRTLSERPAAISDRPSTPAKIEGLPPRPEKPVPVRKLEPEPAVIAKPGKHLPPPADDPQPGEKPHGRKPKTDEPIIQAPPAPAAAPAPREASGAKPRKEDAAPHTAERRAPGAPEPHAPARKAEPASPAGAEPADPKGQGKHRDDKKDPSKPDAPNS